MKTKFILLLVMLMSLSTLLQAQNSSIEKRIQLARDKYPERLEKIAGVKQYEEDEIPNVNYLTVVRKQNWAGAGQSNDKMEYYYDTVEGEFDTQPRAYILVMIRRTYNMGSREVFEEYVYDDQGQPLFWFSKYPDFDGNQIELRSYFAADGSLIRTLNKGNVEKDEAKRACSNARKNFGLFKKAFQAIYGVAY